MASEPLPREQRIGNHIRGVGNHPAAQHGDAAEGPGLDGALEDLGVWARRAGYERSVLAGAIVFADAGGELRYYVRFDGPEFTLSHAQRAETEALLLAAPDLEDVERLLSERIGADLRAQRSEAPVHLPFSLAEIAPGYRLDICGPGWADLIDERANRHVGRFRHTDVPFDAVSFSWYADEDPAAIRAAFEGTAAEFGGTEAEEPSDAHG